MKRSQFNYHCPPELIAQTPAQAREESRLLVFTKDKRIEDKNFSDILDSLNSEFSLKDKNQKLLLIGNNSKVYPARLRVYRKTGAKCEVFILEIGNKEEYSALIKPKSKLQENEILFLDKEGQIPVFQITNFQDSKVKPLFKESISDFLENYGDTPLPPYIKRSANADISKEQIEQKKQDKNRYQNVYAENKRVGSSAAPTAGFHFSQQILDKLPEYNIEMQNITLHVGLGTFLPVKTEEISAHTMHEETYRMNYKTVSKIFEYLENDWPIIFIGTTSLRATESFFRDILDISQQKKLNSDQYKITALKFADEWRATKLFLYPKDETAQSNPLVGNALITNFHQPESSLLMLVSHIIGFQNLQKIYTHAVKNKYRFFSYGDSSLLIFTNFKV